MWSKQRNIILLIIAALFYIATIFLNRFEQSVSNKKSVLEQIEKALHQKEKRALSVLEFYSREKNLDSLFIKYPNKLQLLNEEEDLGFFVYRNDSLVYWSTHTMPVPVKLKKSFSDRRFLRLGNGWYESIRRTVFNRDYFVLIRIKNEFAYQNKYLDNGFVKGFVDDPEHIIVVEEPLRTPLIRTSQGDPIFSVNIFHLNANVKWLNNLEVLLLSLAILLVSIVFISLFATQTKEWSPATKSFTTLFLILALRVLSIVFKIPVAIYSLGIFDSGLYATSTLFRSLGDYLLNALVFYYAIYIIKKYLNTILKFLSGLIIKRHILVILLTLFWIVFFKSLISLFSGLVENSVINFDINNLLALDNASYIGIAASFIFLIGYISFLEELIIELRNSISKKEFSILISVFIIISLTLSYLFLDNHWYLFLMLPSILITIALFKTERMRLHSFGYVVSIVAVLSMCFSQIILDKNYKREAARRKMLADKLAVEIDPVAETLFKSVERNLITDTTLVKCIILPEDKNLRLYDTKKILQQNYFNGYWEKYDLDVFVYNRSGEPVYESKAYTSQDISSFETVINKRGKLTDTKYFYYLNNETGRAQYIARVPIKRHANNQRALGYVFLIFDAKYLSNEIGFPELLLDKKKEESEELSKYSYAKYKKFVLISHYGSCVYPLISAGFTNHGKEEYFLDKDDYNHYVLQQGENQLVVSIAKEPNYYKLTAFSTLFLLFGVFSIMLIVVFKLFDGFTLSKLSLKGRIQLQLLLVLFVSFGLLAIGTIASIRTQYKEKNIATISEKISSILISIEETIGSEKSLKHVSREYLNYLLSKYSNMFFTDINIYDLKGDLTATSRPQISLQGLLGTKMSSQAYYNMKYLAKAEFINEERVGDLRYTSAYVPLKNRQNRLLGYINLPYFAKQSELENEISGYLVTLINIYILLFAIAIITAIIISNKITAPLQLVKEKISNLKLTSRNELIEWKSNDELGNLITEYNRMVVELMNSADTLAKSEREGAWKEMAKQVAHEIKNPLTPMKLGVQLLQRSWNDKSPDFEDRFHRVTTTIIEQIDALSTIATEFSNFAKMPTVNFEEIDLVKCIHQATALYSTSNINLSFDTDLNTAKINGDKDYMIRILNNLVKNAAQSIPETRKGQVKIDLKKLEDKYLLSVADNGSGISSEIAERIFSPNFTTKTTGMGLGLAMVKSMVESMNGKIWFESSPLGTTFFISLPN